MAVGFDAASSTGVDAAGITLSHTTGVGSNRLMVVFITIDGDTISGTPTYAGNNLTLIRNFLGLTYRVYMYYQVPTSGANNLSVSFTTGTPDAGAMVLTYTGVDQASPLVTSTLGANDTASPYGGSIVTTSSNDLVVLGAADDDNTAGARTPLVNTNERRDVVQGSGAGDYGGYMADIITTGVAGSKTITYTDASISESTFILAAFKEATGGAATAKNYLTLLGVGA
jgi:hypothetical protein